MAPADGLKFREMSFTLKDDIYIRYLSYLTKEALKNDLVGKCPVKIDIGAVYNAPPNMHTSVQNFHPLHKELVFDIDMTDYDDIRSCCSGAAVCDKCWVLMTAAIKVVDTTLRHDFGFKHIMWVFSGRRGVHCWVCDPRARKLSHDQRASIVDFLSLYGGKDKKVNLGQTGAGGALHPTLQRAYEQLLPFFEEMIDTQGWFDNKDKIDKLLESYLDPSVRGELSVDDDDQPGLVKWGELQDKVKSYLSKQGKKYTHAVQSVRTLLARLVFGHVYPRLDVNVSKHLNHLLKSPFCVHPKTGKVCVPIDPKQAAGFDPHDVPHVVQLHEELNTAAASGDLSKSNWKSTSLAPFIEYFREFVTQLSNDSRDAQLRAQQMQAKQGAAQAQQQHQDIAW